MLFTKCYSNKSRMNLLPYPSYRFSPLQPTTFDDSKTHGGQIKKFCPQNDKTIRTYQGSNYAVGRRCFAGSLSSMNHVVKCADSSVKQWVTIASPEDVQQRHAVIDLLITRNKFDGKQCSAQEWYVLRELQGPSTVLATRKDRNVFYQV
jgi:hypothetical protein